MKMIHLRLAVLAGAFGLLLAIPLLAFHLRTTFLQGWYQSLSIGGWWIVSPLEGLESILVSRRLHAPLVVGMLTPVVVALLLGRVFCSWLCPIQLFTEAGKRLTAPLRRGAGLPERLRLPRRILWFALAAEVILALVLGSPLFVFLSPPGLVGRELMMAVFFGTLALEGVLVLAVVTLNLFSRHFFCRYLCPLGGLLALLGGRRSLRVEREAATCSACGRCDRACPLALTASGGEGLSPYCWNCGDCVDACGTKALRFSWKTPGRRTPFSFPRPDEPGGFSLKEEKQNEEKSSSMDHAVTASGPAGRSGGRNRNLHHQGAENHPRGGDPVPL
jgi:ferredoxin-type protein NapH